jgi:hypothetical protein
MKILASEERGYSDVLHPCRYRLLWFAYLDGDLKGNLLD